MDNKRGQSFSWRVINDDTVLKNSDKSFFAYNDTGVPKDIKWFFGAKSMDHGKSKKIILSYLGNDYSGTIYIDPMQRCRMTWENALGEELNKRYSSVSEGFPVIRFHRCGNEKYQIEFLDERIIEDEVGEPYETKVIGKEGKKAKYYISKYERNPAIRRSAIRIHGTKCMICGFDFESFYGEAGKSFIEVHHIKPLSDIGEEIEVDPSADVICVCSNCHRMLHRKKNGVFSPEEIKDMIRRR